MHNLHIDCDMHIRFRAAGYLTFDDDPARTASECSGSLEHTRRQTTLRLLTVAMSAPEEDAGMRA